MSPPTASPLIKAFGLAAVLGGMLYVGHAWLSPRPDAATPEASSAPDRSAVAEPTVPTPASTPPPGHLNAKEVAQAYASDREAANARFKGQRMQVHGVVNQIEAGQGQVLLVTLGAGESHGGLRAVIDGGAQPLARQAVVGQSLNLDCLNQGLLMAEPVLSDCRLRP
ncbi:OB-fold putative lipoprotein [Aquabacterium sp. CECT 9606]|uniref:OB-fold putative lipoprotein n=1 Tax=Aquabacterium sp. CECT 9606 TaxID=2845822 RepID=UPI001E2C1C80|nr:OB-fold putative lipoprotein [Aquabacterium sp. CECT 9606]CAH0347805.1 hypothetical protein AQB9606_00024 [Aquabacterium sp. CECT 9606]